MFVTSLNSLAAGQDEIHYVALQNDRWLGRQHLKTASGGEEGPLAARRAAKAADQVTFHPFRKFNLRRHQNL